MTTTKNTEGPGPSQSTLFVTHCSAGKNPMGGNARGLYTSSRVRRFVSARDAAGVLWAIVSAKHALFFPDEWHEWYDTRLSFRGGQLYVYEQGCRLSHSEGEAHIEHLVSAIRARLEELSIGKMVFYVGGFPGRAVAYLLVMHRALDGCTREHRSADEVLKCIEAAGRLHVATSMGDLGGAVAVRQPGRSQTETVDRTVPRPHVPEGPERPRRDIEEVWQRIQAHEGKEFSQKGGKRFRYSVTVSYLRPSTTNQNLPKRHFEEALSFLPLEGPGQINHLRGPSFIYGVLMDDRIRRRDW